jgi:hypothetical protein
MRDEGLIPTPVVAFAVMIVLLLLPAALGG